MTEASLSQKVLKGGFWVFAIRIFERSLGFIRLIIIARLLSPKDFGLFGILLLTLSTLEVFSQTGFHAALVQKNKDIKGYLDTAWTVLVIRGLILYVILFFSAPLIAKFFESPPVSFFIRIIGLTIILRGFSNIGTVYFQKEIEFNKQFILQFIAAIIEFITVVILAYLLRSVWALVIGQLMGGVSGLITGYMIHPYRPKFTLDKNKAQELFTFGKWIFGSSIIIFLLTQGDDAFLGKFLGITMLGFYQMAYRISNMPVTEITHMISKVIFPAYSKMHKNLPWLKESHLRVLQLTASLSFPIAVMIFILAPDFTKIFLGEKWMPIIPTLKVLCIFGITRSLNATFGPIFQGMGKPKTITFVSGIQLVILCVLIYPLTSNWGILGTSVAVAIPNFLVVFYLNKKLAMALRYTLSNIILPLLPPTIGAVILSIFLFLFRYWLEINLIQFILSISLGTCIYIIMTYKIDKYFKCGLKSSIINLLKGIRA